MIDQRNKNIECLFDKLSLFVACLGNQHEIEDISQFDELCNGLAFMMFRADLIDQEDQNINRMYRIVGHDDEEIKQLAQLYKKYKSARRFLVENQDGEEELPTLNRTISKLQNTLTAMRNENEKNSHSLQNIENKIREFRNQRNLLIEKNLNESFATFMESIIEAEEIYFYIHTLIAAFSPADHLNLRSYGKSVNQCDFIEMLQLVPPDALLPKEKNLSEEIAIRAEVEIAFKISFVFKEQELINLLNDENILRDDDYILLVSTDHAIYLSKKNGQFKLYNPEPIEIESNDSKQLFEKIKYGFFTAYDIRSEFIPIAIIVFQKNSLMLKKTARPRSAEYIKILLKDRLPAEINVKSWDGLTGVAMAADYGDAEVIEVLVQAQADLNEPDENGNTPAHLATINGHANVIDELAKGGADLNAKNKLEDMSPAHFAALCGHVNVIEALANAGADLDAQDKNGHSPAHVAVQNGHSNVIEALAKRGANLNAQDKNGYSPIHFAAYNGHTNVIEALANAGSDLEAKNEYGVSPAHLAAFNGHVNVIQVLANAGADLNAKNKYGLSPAHLAAYNGHVKVIEVLAKRGADLNAQDKDGNSPAHLAAQNGHCNVLDALIRAGVDLDVQSEEDSSTDEHPCLDILMSIPDPIYTIESSSTTMQKTLDFLNNINPDETNDDDEIESKKELHSEKEYSRKRFRTEDVDDITLQKQNDSTTFKLLDSSYSYNYLNGKLVTKTEPTPPTLIFLRKLNSMYQDVIHDDEQSQNSVVSSPTNKKRRLMTETKNKDETKPAVHGLFSNQGTNLSSTKKEKKDTKHKKKFGHF